MKKVFLRAAMRPSVRLGKHGRPMRDPDGHDVDITADLVDGRDGALADNLPQNGQGGDAQMQAPAGTQHVHGDAKPVNQQQQGQQQQPTAAKPDKELTLRDQLSNAFKGNDEKPTDQQNANTADPAAKPAAAPVALTQDNDGKWRTPDGLFASNEQVQAFQAAQAAPPPQQQQQQQQSPVLAGLTPVEQQQLQSLPAELRQHVERTMEGLNTRAQRYSEYDTLEQAIIGPRRQAWAQQGTNPLVAMNQLFALSDFASTNPGQFVMWFSEQQNLDLDALLDARDAAQQQQQANPQLAQLQGTVNQISNYVQQQQTQQQQQMQQANLTAVEQYATEKDASGALKRPYITEVLDDWTTQIAAVRAANPLMQPVEVMERAYQNACWSNPAIRAKMQQTTATQQQQQAQQRVDTARAAGSSIAGGPAGDQSTIPNNANRSLREELESQFTAARAV